MATEIMRQCWFGRRWKKGKLVKPSSCHNRATGVYLVVTEAFGREVETPWLLCANCGLNAMPNRVRAFEDERGELRFYKDVKRITLIKTLDTEFDQTKRPAQPGDKHWVEPTKKETAPTFSFTRTRIKTRDCDFKPMDMAAYRRRLANHDDEK